MTTNNNGIFSNWSDAQIKILKDAWLNGLSATQVSKKIWDDFGVARSRSACLGKIFRLGLIRKNQ